MVQFPRWWSHCGRTIAASQSLARRLMPWSLPAVLMRGRIPSKPPFVLLQLRGRPAELQKKRAGARGPSYIPALSNTRPKTPRGVVKKTWERRGLTLCILRQRNQEVPGHRSSRMRSESESSLRERLTFVMTSSAFQS